MKKIIGMSALILSLNACNEAANDRTENKLDSLGEKIEEKAGEVWDSTKSKATKIGDKVEDRLDRAGDTLDKKEDSLDKRH